MTSKIKQVTSYIPPSDYDALREVAAARQRTISKIVADLISKYLNSIKRREN